jgi:hypothetical protein
VVARADGFAENNSRTAVKPFLTMSKPVVISDPLIAEPWPGYSEFEAAVDQLRAVLDARSTGAWWVRHHRKRTLHFGHCLEAGTTGGMIIQHLGGVDPEQRSPPRPPASRHSWDARRRSVGRQLA